MTDSMTSTTMSANDMMVPYLHFAGGDHLFFQAWTPTSAGALVGACIGLVVLSLFERWLAATRRAFEAECRRRALLLTHDHDQAVVLSQKLLYSRGSNTSNEHLFGPNDIQETSRERSSARNGRTGIVKSQTRTIPPFILAHDIPRGVLYALQTLILYALMLAVMTFQAAFIISIILGLSTGDVIFGRVANAGAGAAHHC